MFAVHLIRCCICLKRCMYTLNWLFFIDVVGITLMNFTPSFQILRELSGNSCFPELLESATYDKNVSENL